MHSDTDTLLSPLIERPVQTLNDGQKATAMVYRGVARTLIGRCDDGIADWRSALRLAPRHTVAMQNLALAYLQQGRFTRARYWLRRARKLRGNDPLLRSLRRQLYRAEWRRALVRVGRRWLRRPAWLVRAAHSRSPRVAQ